MQDRPTASELLKAIEHLLDDEVLEATTGPLRHRVRVAAIVPKDSMPGLDVADEAAVIQLASSGGVSAATIHDVCKDEKHVAAPFFLTAGASTFPCRVILLT